jgi:predicted alpha/beta-fold hydrolase
MRRTTGDVLEFLVPRWLRSPHVQSLFNALPVHASPRMFADVDARPLRIAIPSQSNLPAGALHATAWWHAEGNRTAAILVHGVGGSSESRYMVRAAVALYRAGFHVVRLNLRGAGDSIPDAPLLYHAGLVDDPRLAALAVGAMPRVDGVALVGFSLGGNVVLRLAGEWKARFPSVVRAVAAVSAPMDLVQVSRAIERKRSLPYRAYILRALVRQGTDFAAAHPARAHYDVSALPHLRTIRAYDEAVVAPMHDFASAQDYYARTSCGTVLPDVRIPTLVVHADDDPVVPGESVTPWLRDASPAVKVAWSARGGHVGWFGGLGEGAWVNTWAMNRVVEHLRAHTR